MLFYAVIQDSVVAKVVDSQLTKSTGFDPQQATLSEIPEKWKLHS